MLDSNDPPTNEAELEVLLKARSPLLCVVSSEEERVERLLLRLADRLGLRVAFWSLTQGLCDHQGEGLPGGPESNAPGDALRLLLEDGGAEDAEVYVLRDLHLFFTDPSIVRQLRDLRRAFRLGNRMALLLSPYLELPRELEAEAEVYRFSLPDADGLRRFLNRFLRNLDVSFEEAEVVAAARALEGLTELQSEGLVARSLVRTRTLDPSFLAAERDRLLAAEGAPTLLARRAREDPSLARALQDVLLDPAAAEELRELLEG